MVHLIYRSKNYESSSKDYDFSHVGMVEHWSAGVRDVHLSMRHKDWLERPQSGETMVTYDLTGDGTAIYRSNSGKQERRMGTLTGKTAVVTGSTSGIGLAYARAFAGAGANIVINGMGAPADIEKERSAIETDFKVKAVHSPADMTKPAEIADMVALGEKTFGSVDILVNNAGIQFVSPVEDFPPEKWEAIIAINLSSAFYGIRAAVPGMKKRGWGRIINTASAHSLVASPFKSAYVSAKHGIAGLTKTVALEVRDLQDHLQLHQPRLCLDPAGRAPDSGDHEGAQHDQGAGHPRRAAGRAADQGVRHVRAGRGASAVPVRRRRRADHRHQPLDRRRLDRGVSVYVMPAKRASSMPRRSS